MDRYKEVSKKLQDPNLNPDRLTLSTVHSVKGAQWDHVALCCSYGFFPANRADKSTLLESQLEKLGEKIPWDSATRAEAVEKAHAHIEDPMTSERNLAYVGITRAKTDLEVICSQERVSPRDKGSSGAPILGKFIKEAELTPGQNVKVAPAEAPPVEEPPPEVLPEVKLAFVSDDEEVGRYLPNVHSYDRRMP